MNKGESNRVFMVDEPLENWGREVVHFAHQKYIFVYLGIIIIIIDRPLVLLIYTIYRLHAQLQWWTKNEIRITAVSLITDDLEPNYTKSFTEKG